MRYSTTLSMLSGIAALSGFTMAHPLFDSQLVKRDSPDDTCGLVVGGAGNGYSCGASNTGTCCSQYGYCGATANYCGTGCQAAYGTGCTGVGGGGGDVCGPNNGGASCATGSCCSVNGFCGTTDDYCLPANGCQAAYGICTSGGGGTGGGDCGPANGNAVCPTGQCCSPAGFCGTTEQYCQSPDCLRGFGTCDSDKTPAGASTADVPRPLLGSVSYDNDIYDCLNPAQIALTFDDGPYTYTNDLLDKLAAYGFKATFFITGVNNGKGPIDSTPAWSTVIRRMITDGHQVASHTWSHADLSLLSNADRATEMIKNEMAFRNIIGKFPTYMRPPYSSCNAACKVTMKSLGYHITYFGLDTQDYLHTTPDTNQISKDLVHGIISGANPATTEFLSIAHDIHEQTVHNFTTYMFDQMVQYGFTGVTAGKCLNDPEANWYRTPGASNSTSSTSSSTSTTSSSSSSTSSSSSETTTTTSTSTTSSTTSPTTTTTSSSTTTSSPTTSPKSPTTSTTATSTITPTTTTSAPTSTPTSTCPFPKIGNWCCKRFTFNSRVSCIVARATCLATRAECLLQSGLNPSTGNQQCGTWSNNVCQKLAKFCDTCPLFGTCDSNLFTV